MEIKYQTRPPVKRQQILQEVRSSILDGRRKPGDRLPTRKELGQTYAAGEHTVQRALDLLVADGFVEVQGARGTFVASNPPNLCRFGVYFPDSPNGWPHGRSRFYEAIEWEARALAAEGAIALPSYYLSRSRDISQTFDTRDLQRDYRSHRLAGLIFSAPPFALFNSPVLEEPGFPRVEIGIVQTRPHVAAVNLDFQKLLDRALLELASAGCRRVAMIVGRLTDDILEAYRSAIHRHGMTTQSCWLHAGSYPDKLPARHIAELLMQAPPEKRPDSLIILDDNMVTEATHGLVAAGVRSAEELRVIAHANFPHPTHSYFPARRIGFNIRALLQTCIERIGQQQRGETPPPMTLLAPQFENEVVSMNQVMS
ncbi:MAG TPA: GntR family transcriptional regulator [Tepidisphaeraceae bacterium]|jgi:DNA-binding LacI/PurR family transcriptional regulator